MAYYYVKKTYTTNQTNITTTFNGSGTLSIGDYFLLAGQSTATENGVYLRDSLSVNTKLATQPTISTDSIISVLDDQEWKRTATNTYTQQSALSAGAAIRLAVLNYNSGATKPVPVGTSSFPDSIDELKILDYSSDISASGHLEDYYDALKTFYTSPSASNANAVEAAAANVQNYILTETDYNKLASAVMNTQLYIKQYLEDQFTAVGDAIDAYINQSDSYVTDTNALMIKVSASDPNPDKEAARLYLWFDEV
jgi:hypothetical protein